MWLLAIYDIADPRRLNRVARILKDYGNRVQKSKFEIELSEASFTELQKRIASVIENEVDGVKYVPLCNRCLHKIEIIGKGSNVDREQGFVVI